MRSEKTDQDFIKFWSHIPWEAKDETLIVLKGHLLVEDLLREYCATKVKNEQALVKAKLTFPQVMHLAKALMSYTGPTWIWGGCEKLNSLRNDLAHKLTPANYEQKRNDLMRFVLTESKPTVELLESFKERHERLGIVVFLLFSALSAHLHFKPAGLLSLVEP